MTGTAEAFTRLYGREPEVVWRAPGRVNLVGEHTDYNDGYVLPLAVPLDIRVATARRSDRVLRVASRQEASAVVEVVLDDLAPGAVSGWSAYVGGTAWALLRDGVDVPGADLLVDGELPRGAGLSSSAALECASAGALLDLAGATRSPMQVALLAQRAENDVVGMPCGLMDQVASTSSREGHLLLLDTRSMTVEHVPFDLRGHGLTLLVVDTRAPHRLVDGEYAARRSDCRRACAALGVPSLRDVSDLGEALEALPDETLRRRVRHVVTENDRVLEAVARLRDGDVRGIGSTMTASHRSLRDDYEVSCPELDLAVDAAVRAGAHGARMTGGGFGGSAIALVDTDAVPVMRHATLAAFAAAGLTEPQFLDAVPSAGYGRLA